MITAGLIDQDRLDGASNFGVWKVRMLFLLYEYGLKEFATTFIIVPTYPIHFHEYRSDNAKAKRMMMV